MLLATTEILARPWLYKDGGSNTTGVILCHGKGGDPEYYVVDPLRVELHEQLGLHTISLQMPGGYKPLVDYKADFPEAFRLIESGVNYLRQKKVTTIYLIAHSLGSRMATAYLAAGPAPAIKGFVGVGMLNNGGPPFDCLANLKKSIIPVLDIWGAEGKAGDRVYGRKRQELVSRIYQQVEIAGGDHALSDHEDELVETVVTWLKQQNKNRKRGDHAE